MTLVSRSEKVQEEWSKRKLSRLEVLGIVNHVSSTSQRLDLRVIVAIASGLKCKTILMFVTEVEEGYRSSIVACLLLRHRMMTLYCQTLALFLSIFKYFHYTFI